METLLYKRDTSHSEKLTQASLSPRSIGAFNISLPTSWDELIDKQLLMVYGLFARDLSAAEVKTLCLMKWNHLKLLATLPDKRSIMKKEGEQEVVLSVRQIQQATTVLDFLDSFPPMPVRITQIGKYTVFGEVVEGLDVVEKIQNVPTNSADRPLEDIVVSMEVM